MATFIKDQFPIITAPVSEAEDSDSASSPIAAKKEAIAVKPKETAEYNGIY